MKKAISLLLLLFVCATTLVFAQQSLKTFQTEIQRIESLVDEKEKSKARGVALATLYDTRIAEVGKQSAINEVVPHLKKLIDYDFRAAYEFILKVKNRDDGFMFTQNYFSQSEQALFKSMANTTVNNYNYKRDDDFASNVPKNGYGVKGKWTNTATTIPKITTNLPSDGNTELVNGYAAFDKKNYTEALRLFKSAAEKGSTDAMVEIGIMYYKGEGVTKSFTEAHKWLKLADDKGNSNAWPVIASIYILQNQFEDAFKVYKKAADKGYEAAMHMTALMYIEGKGVAANKSEAKLWLQKASNKGYEKSKNALKELLASEANGNEEFNKGKEAFDKDDFESALYWYKLAVSKGHPNAQVLVEFMEKNMSLLNAEKKHNKYPSFKDENGKFGFKDANGKIIVPAKYTKVQPFSEGLAPVSIDGKWGYIDLTGKEVIPLKYGDALAFSEGLAAVKPVVESWNTFYGFIDKTGKLIIPHEYPFVFDTNLAYDGWMFINGKAKVYNKDKKLVYIDKTGKEVK